VGTGAEASAAHISTPAAKPLTRRLASGFQSERRATVLEPHNQPLIPSRRLRPGEAGLSRRQT
jgi:hypothetical protein